MSEIERKSMLATNDRVERVKASRLLTDDEKAEFDRARQALKFPTYVKSIEVAEDKNFPEAKVLVLRYEPQIRSSVVSDLLREQLPGWVVLFHSASLEKSVKTDKFTVGKAA